MQAWREDRTLVVAAECVADALGQRYVDSVPLSLGEDLGRVLPNRACNMRPVSR